MGTTPETDPIRYPGLDRDIQVGDILNRYACGCVMVYIYEWHLKPCEQHGWKVAS